MVESFRRGSMKLGLVLAVYNHVPLRDALRKAADAGCETVELFVHKGNGFVDLAELATRDGARNLQHTLSEFSIQLSTLGIQTESQLLLGPHGTTTDAICPGSAVEKIAFAQERLRLAADAAQRLELDTICGMCGCEDGTRWFPWPDPEGWEKMAPTFVERWNPILDMFAQRGLRFAHECHPNQYAYNTETALATIRLLEDRPEWGFNLDPGNLMLSGVDPVVFVAELGDRIFHVHAKDGELVPHNVRRSGLLANGAWERRDRGYRFRVPGWGDVPWRRLLTELRMANYDRVISVEHEDPTMSRDDGVSQGISFLRPLLVQKPFEGRWW